MFGTPSFGSAQPTEVGPSKYINNLEDNEILEASSKFFGEELTFAADDLEAIRRRYTIIFEKSPKLNEDRILELSILDRIVNSASKFNIQSDKFFDPEFAKIYVGDGELGDDKVFINTVLSKAEDLYTSGECVAFSDALKKATEIRLKEFGSTPEIKGTINNRGEVTVH